MFCLRRRRLQSAAWTLVRESREVTEGELTAFAGRCLALLGPVGPDRIAFDSQTASRVSPSTDSGSSLKGSIAAQSMAMMNELLQHLAVYAVDDSPQIVAIAQATLRQVR